MATTPLFEAKARLSLASHAMDGFMHLLANCGGDGVLAAEEMRSLLLPIAEEMHMALDELEHAPVP